MTTTDAPAIQRDAKGRLTARPEGSGRKKGTPNKVTYAVREMIHKALDRAGGADYLYRCATSDETPLKVAFLGLVKTVIPRQVEAEVGASLEALLEKSYQLADKQDDAPKPIDVKVSKPTTEPPADAK